MNGIVAGPKTRCSGEMSGSSSVRLLYKSDRQCRILISEKHLERPLYTCTFNKRYVSFMEEVCERVRPKKRKGKGVEVFKKSTRTINSEIFLFDENIVVVVWRCLGVGQLVIRASSSNNTKS